MHKGTMRRGLLALLGLAGATMFGGAAMAADISRPVYKAPPAGALPVAYDWTGFYIGGHVGYGWADKYWQRRFGFGRSRTTPTDSSAAARSASTTRSASSCSASKATSPGRTSRAAPRRSSGSRAPVDATFNTEVDWTATLTGRLGLAFDRWLVYGKGGVAWADDSYATNRYTFPARSRSATPASAGPPAPASNTPSRRTGRRSSNTTTWTSAPAPFRSRRHLDRHRPADPCGQVRHQLQVRRRPDRGALLSQLRTFSRLKQPRGTAPGFFRLRAIPSVTLAQVLLLCAAGRSGDVMNFVLGICAAVAALVGLGLLWWRSRVGREIALMASLADQRRRHHRAAAARHGRRGEGHAAGARAAHGRILATALPPITNPRSSARKPITSATSQGRDQRRTRTTTVYTEHEIRPVPGRGPDRQGSASISTAPRSRRSQVVNEPTAARAAAAAGRSAASCRRWPARNASYRRKESILAPDIAVYVLGEVQQGGLIGKPARGSKNRTFVISHKSEEERTNSLASTTRWLLAIGIIAAGLVRGIRVGRRPTSSQGRSRAPEPYPA